MDRDVHTALLFGDHHTAGYEEIRCTRRQVSTAEHRPRKLRELRFVYGRN